MSSKVYVLMSLQKDLFVKACRLHRRLYSMPGYPFQVVDSLDYAKKKCRGLNLSNVVLHKDFVYFYKELCYYEN